MANMLKLDPAIRDWVLIPIFAAMFLISVLRHYATKLMRTEKKVDLGGLKEAQAVIRSQRLRFGGRYIPGASVRSRVHYFVNKETGVFCQKSTKLTPQQEMLQDPNAMTGMMKNNLGMMVPQMLTMAWVNFFFSGFVVAKVPFPLTQKFRSMLQRGVDLATLDVTYVSSLSWYFLNMFGLRGLLSVALGEETVDDAALMQQQMQMGMDTNQAYKAEKDALEHMPHEWALPGMEASAERFLRAAVARGGGAA